MCDPAFLQLGPLIGSRGAGCARGGRYGFIGATDKCRLCNFPLLTRQFYLFPCQHCFHADCLTTEVSPPRL